MATSRRRKKTPRPPDTGPLTLAQARALAAARRPSRSAKRALAATPTPRPVGEARAALDKKRSDERARRIRDYTATLALLERRGVKGLPAAAAPGAAPAAGAGAPLRILAEGDSWFEYPVPFFGGGIIPRLEDELGVPILNLAKAGDEVRFMLGVGERKDLIDELKNGCPTGGPWDVVLFSGGGNDVVDDPMALWIKDYDAAQTPAWHVHQARFEAALALVRAGYEDLIALRDAHSPGTLLVFHAYDFAIPDGRDVCFFGPWLKPTFDLRGFPGPSTGVRFEVVKEMLKRFAAMLTLIEAGSLGVKFIDTQGTLAPKKGSWHNELHPDKAGFKALAKRFHAELKQKFPGRVL